MRKLLLITLFLISANLYSQSYNFLRLDNTNGLSNNQIESIIRDSRGFMWFGTNYGLNRYDGYSFKVYKTIKDDTTSISFNSIKDIQEDIDGNLWLRGSIYQVYNVRTEKFYHNISSIIASFGVNFLPSIVEIDKQKNFYFYEQNKAVYKYDVRKKRLNKFKQANGSNSLSEGRIISIRPMGDTFWVLYQSGLVERYNERTSSVDFRNKYIKENIAGATITKNLYIDNTGNPWVYPGLADKGVLWYDMKKGFWRYFGNDKRDFLSPDDKYITSDFVRDIEQDQNNRIWIATDHGGVNIYDKNNDSLTVLVNDPMNPNSISQNSTIRLYCDSTGIMWVGTYKNGVSYYHPQMFKFDKSPLFFYQSPRLESKDCNSLFEDSKGVLWIGTNGSGLLSYNSSTGNFKHYKNEKNNPSSISSDIIISSLEDRSGSMWFGTFLGGLNQMKGESFMRYLPDENNPNSLSNKSIYGLVEDENQNIWIATLGGGINQLDAGRNRFTHFNTSNTKTLTSDYVLSLYSRSPGTIYFCTATGVEVLNTFDKTISPLFKNREQSEKLTEQIINYTFLDNRNLLWIATDNGLNIYNPERKSISYLNAANGLPSEQVVSIAEDNYGNIWAGTRNGLAYIQCSKGVNDYSFNVITFDEKDGLVSNIFNQNAVFRNKHGKIYFGTTKGYIIVDLDNIRFNKIVPRPRLCALIVGNEEILPGKEYRGSVILEQSIIHTDKIVLNHNANNFTLKFSALGYIHPQKNKYKYTLKGFETEWHETTGDIGKVTYTNLNQGSYELLIYASNNDNLWSREPLVVNIIIKPPFWLSWWAIIIYALLSVAIIWSIVNYNLRKQKREFEREQRMREAQQLHEIDEMKFRFFTNISHEFRTPLTLILSPVEKLLQHAKSDEDKNLIDIIQRNANNLLELVNQLLDFRRLEDNKDKLHLSVGDVIAFIKDICYSFTELANRKSIVFTFTTSVSELRMEFDPEKLKKIIYNLLSNSFKFTNENGKVELVISLVQHLNNNEKFLKVVVSDTGVGILEKDLDRIFERFYRVESPDNMHKSGTGVGLHIVSEYIKLHKGQIEVESKEGKGSVFTVTIPAIQHVQEEVISSVENITTPHEAQILETIEEERKSKLPLMLIVDDNNDFRKFLGSLFSANYRIIMAADGEEALKMTIDKLPDLIIADVMMPKLDGYELCRQIKHDIRVSHIPIILLTAKAGDDNKLRGIEAGADDYIAKPFNMEMLSLKVSQIIERQRMVHDQFRKKVNINPVGVEITSLDEKFVKKAVALVESNIENADFLVEDLCREMGMSRVHFYKKILSLTDKTPSEFIRFIRLKRAADLLEKSQLFVNEIAYQVGFNDPKYFRKYFKDEFGVSPNEYKKKFDK